jgi:hypothetical protein
VVSERSAFGQYDGADRRLGPSPGPPSGPYSQAAPARCANSLIILARTARFDLQNDRSIHWPTGESARNVHRLSRARVPDLRAPPILAHPHSARASASVPNIFFWLLWLLDDVYRSIPIHPRRKEGNLRIGELCSGGRRKTTVSKILIRTASWTNKTLIASGRFYPPKCNSPGNG